MTTLVRRLTRRKVERVCKSENRSTAHSIISRHGCSPVVKLVQGALKQKELGND